MKKKLLFIPIITLCLSIVLATTPLATTVYAQNPVTSPSFNCLGPCASGSPSSTGYNTSTGNQPYGLGAPSPLASSGSQTSNTQPCNTLLPNLSAQHREFGDGRRGRGGFLERLFEFLLQLIVLIIGSNTGLSGISTPCSPATVTSPQPAAPSVAPVSAAPQPSVIATSPASSQSSSSSSSSSNSSSSSSSTSAGSSAPAETSNNWGGYVTTTSFPANSVIKSDWVVSALDCSGGDGTISPWPGFGGWDQSDPNIAQLGNDMACSSGQATYPAWTEAFPANSVYSQNPMSAGDHMTATVTFQGGGKFATTMTNQTKGWTINTPMDFNSSSYAPKTAEVIFEALEGGNSSSSGGNSKIPVPKFAPLTFTNAAYSSGAQQSPLGSGPSLKTINLGVNNDVQVTTGPISGNTFTQTFVHN